MRYQRFSKIVQNQGPHPIHFPNIRHDYCLNFLVLRNQIQILVYIMLSKHVYGLTEKNDANSFKQKKILTNF